MTVVKGFRQAYTTLFIICACSALLIIVSLIRVRPRGFSSEHSSTVDTTEPSEDHYVDTESECSEGLNSKDVEKQI
jgi:hypothetical protein